MSAIEFKVGDIVEVIDENSFNYAKGVHLIVRVVSKDLLTLDRWGSWYPSHLRHVIQMEFKWE